MPTEVKGTQDGNPVVTDSPTPVTKDSSESTEVELLKTQLAAQEEDATRREASYEQRIGNLLSANGDRAKEAEERENRLTDRLADVEKWQDNIAEQSLEPGPERDAFRSNKLQQRIEQMELERNKERQEALDNASWEKRRGVAYQEAVALGVPIDQIDHTSPETIKASMTKWIEQAAGREMAELRSTVTDLQKEISQTRSDASANARSNAGDTAVVAGDAAVASAGVGAVNPDANLEGLPDGAVALIKEGEGLVGKKGKGGRIMMIQFQLQSEYGLDVEFKND